MLIPSTLALKKALCSYLSSDPDINAIADISSSHPTSAAALSKPSRVAISSINDIYRGSVITRGLSAPSIQFACWSKSEPRAERLKELVAIRIETWTPASLPMPDQRILVVRQESDLGVVFDSGSELFVASVEFRFKLAVA